jgi:Region found in RelA / SpoT proteins
VLPSIKDVDALVETYEESFAKNPTARSEYIKKFDYIRYPKVDGYRSVHLIYKYRSSAPQYAIYNGLRIEIQLRTQLQHTWATAVETVSTFTGQALKANVGTEEWKRFFMLMGSAIARRERRPVVPNTPDKAHDSVKELRKLSGELRAKTVLQGMNAALTMATSGSNANAQFFLLELDTKRLSIKVTGYDQRDFARASKDYLVLEKENQLYPERQTVLVSVDSIDALRAAYPNYYMDTEKFLDAVTRATS